MRQLTQDELFEAARKIDSLPLDRQELLKLSYRSTLARELPLGVEGFKHYYWCIWRRELQPYADQWVDMFASKQWTILECFRGSGKSTDLSITFMSYVLGKDPTTSVLIVQANDDAANKTSSLIASIIEHFEGWRACFPVIVPDKERGWGARGYFIKDSKQDYGHWLELCARDHMKDPSFVGAGVSSADIVGMHPKWLLFDDIHDQTNSVFPRERKKIVDIVRANVLPVITKPGSDKPFIGVACTPWDEEDAYSTLYKTGLFKKAITPILQFCDDGDTEFEGKKCKLTWPEGFPLDSITQLRKVNSKAEFARMYLCDLSEAKKRLFTYYSYPEDQVDWKAPIVGGVDYASISLSTNATEGDLSHFAMAFAIKLPMGGAVIGGGVLEQMSQARAEIEVTKAQNIYPNWEYCVMESNGVGAEFIKVVQRNPTLRIIPRTTQSVFDGSKATRQYELLSPLFERAVLRVSDADTDFLNTLRSYLENYPNLDRHAAEWDVADAVVWAVVGIPSLFEQAKAVEEDVNAFSARRSVTPGHTNPFAALSKRN
jgi:hypothetical protein